MCGLISKTFFFISCFKIILLFFYLDKTYEGTMCYVCCNCPLLSSCHNKETKQKQIANLSRSSVFVEPKHFCIIKARLHGNHSCSENTHIPQDEAQPVMLTFTRGN